MKKYMFILMAVLVCVLCVACGESAPAATTEPTQPTETTEATLPPCAEHQWQEAACYSPKTCSVCGATEGGPVHQYEIFSTQEATCVEPGKIEYFCKICDDPMYEEILPTGHTVENGVCTVCGEAVKE